MKTLFGFILISVSVLCTACSRNQQRNYAYDSGYNYLRVRQQSLPGSDPRVVVLEPLPIPDYKQPFPGFASGAVPVYLTGNGINRPTCINPTDRPMDLTIEGEGFFPVMIKRNGRFTTGYTRRGNFTIDAEGRLALGNSSGPLLVPYITIPEDTIEIVITCNGSVTVKVPGHDGFNEVGKIELSSFEFPSDMAYLGDEIYVATELSGEKVEGEPGTSGLGMLSQGMVELAWQPRFVYLLGIQ